jgi:hypothetical protein
VSHLKTESWLLGNGIANTSQSQKITMVKTSSSKDATPEKTSASNSLKYGTPSSGKSLASMIKAASSAETKKKQPHMKMVYSQDLDPLVCVWEHCYPFIGYLSSKDVDQNITKDGNIIITLIITLTIYLGGKARFNSVEDLQKLIPHYVPFANKDTAHWIGFANPDCPLYEDEGGVVAIFDRFKDSFKATFPTNGVVEVIKLNDDEAATYADCITKMIKGRYAFEVLS